jgi:tRNA pseudouridine55 synthase
MQFLNKKLAGEKGIEGVRKLALDGGLFLLVDKDLEWTSFNVIGKMRGVLGIKKIGHAGTLDPLATGLLLLGIGRGTKKLGELTGLDKVYSGEIKLGANTESDDREYPEINPKDTSNISPEDIEKVRKGLTGKILQLPPRFSAKKIKGRKMYDMARKGQSFERKESEVEIFSFEIIEFSNPIIKFKIHCSKGTYIRSIARDFGDKLGVGGYLLTLRREKIANFDITDALTISELENIFGD